jgi:DNA modification methylase
MNRNFVIAVVIAILLVIIFQPKYAVLTVAVAGCAALVYITIENSPGALRRIAGGKPGGVLDLDHLDSFSFEIDANVKYPLFADQITKQDLLTRTKELKGSLMKIIQESTKPYDLIAVVERANVVGKTLHDKPLKFISTWDDTERYDNLALYFTEEQLLKCTTGQYRPLQTNFQYFGKYLYDQLAKKKSNPTPTEFRDYIFDNIKSCHNFRCTLAAKIYTYFNAESVLDFSAGWGDRLYAACALDIKYMGIDPNQALREPYDNIISTVGSATKQTVVTSGAEYLSHERVQAAMQSIGVKEFDLLFTSPPYFDYEIYSTGPQSVNSYTSTYEKWLVYFLLYTLSRYAQYIKEGGHMVIYMQDVGNNIYLEPIILFISAWHDYLGLSYAGVFSSNRFPSIVFEKSRTKASIPAERASELLKTHYPKIHAMASKLWKIGLKNIHFSVIPDFIESKDNQLFVFDTGENASLDRSFYKVLLAEPNDITDIIWYGTKAVGERITRMNDQCVIHGKQMTYCVAKNELEWETQGKRVTYKKTPLSTHVKKAMEAGMKLESFHAKDAGISNIEFLRKEIAKKYAYRSDTRIIPLEVFSYEDNFYCAESIRELLLSMDAKHPAAQDPKTYSGTIFMSIKTSDYLEALYKVFPLANFYVLVPGIRPRDSALQKSRTKLVYDHTVSFNKPTDALADIKDVTLKEKITRAEPSISAIYPHFLREGKKGDVCLFYT